MGGKNECDIWMVQSEEKKIRRKVVIAIVLFFVLFVISIFTSADKYLKSSFWESDLIRAQYLFSNDISGDLEDAKITGMDPYVVFSIDEGQYDRGIVYFSEPAEYDEFYCLFFINNLEESEEWGILNCKRYAKDDYISFSIPYDKNIKYLRLDLESPRYGQKLQLDCASLVKKTIISDLHAVLNRCTQIKLLIAILVLVTVIIAVYSKLDFGQYHCGAIQKIVSFDWLLLIMLPLILFWKYLSGQAYFMFLDVGADSFGQLFPALTHMADRVSEGQWGECYSFLTGLGIGEESIFPNLTNWVSLFGRDKVAYLMGVSICLKMVFSGILAYKFVGAWGVIGEKRLLISLGYEFNAMLTVRSCWESYPNLALLIVLWLYSFEQLYRNRTVFSALFFIISGEFFFVQFGIFYCVLYGGIFAVYIICRTITERTNPTTSIAIILLFIFSFLVGTLDSITESLSKALSSQRFYSGTEEFIYNAKELLCIKWENLYDAFIRTIGQTIGGINQDEFIGFGNFLEGPAFYFGILMLLLIPMAYYNLPTPKRIVFSLGIFIAFLYITIPAVRLLLSGFSGNDSYKTSSYWIVVMLILMVIEAFCNIKSNGLRLHSIIIFNITVFLSVLLLLVALFEGRVVFLNHWWQVLLYCIIYALCINFIFVYNQKVFLPVFIAAIVSEGLVISYPTINDRLYITDNEIETLYYGDVYSAIHEVVDNDDDWNRSEKYPYSVSMCDSLVQKYYGTSSYVGGVGIDDSILNYYYALGLPYDESGRNLYGSVGNFYANSLLGVKYIFLNGMSNFRYGNSYYGSQGNVDIYENDYALPLGYCYDKLIRESDFLELSYLDKNRILLEKCVLSNELYEEMNSFVCDDDCIAMDLSNHLVCEERVYDDTVEKIYTGDLNGKLLNVEIEWRSNGTYVVAGEQMGVIPVFWSDSNGKVSYQDFSWNGVKELLNNDIQYIWLDENNRSVINAIRIYAYDPEKYYSKCIADIGRLKDNGFIIENISAETINGMVNSASDGIFATSIPFDSRWDIYIDGNKEKTFVVNTGFVGCRISRGSHDVKLVFRHKTWLESNIYKLTGFLCAVFIIPCTNLCLKKWW